MILMVAWSLTSSSVEEKFTSWGKLYTREWFLNIFSNKRIFARFKVAKLMSKKNQGTKLIKMHFFKLVITLFGS